MTFKDTARNVVHTPSMMEINVFQSNVRQMRGQHLREHVSIVESAKDLAQIGDHVKTYHVRNIQEDKMIINADQIIAILYNLSLEMVLVQIAPNTQEVREMGSNVDPISVAIGK